MKRNWLAIMMAAVLSIALTACGGASTTATNEMTATNETNTTTNVSTETIAVEDVKLKVWAPENQVQSGTIDAMCQLFQEKNPQWHIEFVVEAQGEDTLKEEILKDVGAAGDVFFCASDQIAELVNAGAIAKLGGKAEELVQTTVAESVIDTVMVDGSTYAIPFTHNTFFMFYDKSLLSEEDVKSVEGIMAKKTAEDVYNFCFDSAGGWKLAAWYYGADLTIYGTSQTDYASGCDWNSDKGIAVTKYLIDLVNNPKCAYNEDVSLSELAEVHRIGAWFDGSWNYDLYKEILGDDLGLAVIPTFNPDGNDYQLKSFYSSKAIGVNSQATNPAVAVAFATFIGGEEMQMLRFEKTSQVPTNLTAGASEVVQANEIAAVLVGEANVASIKQPTSAEFNSRYWSNAGGIAVEIRSGELNHDNVQEKMDAFAATLEVQ